MEAFLLVVRCPLEEAFIAPGQCQDAPEEDSDDVFIPPVIIYFAAFFSPPDKDERIAIVTFRGISSPD